MDKETLELLTRLVEAFEGMNIQLERINDEGIVILNDAGMNEN